jgi:hypothetical protein
MALGIPEDTNQATATFFEAAESLIGRVEVLNMLCCVCFVVAAIQLLQLVAYFNEAHPKMALLTDVVHRAFSWLWHLVVLLFLILFLGAFIFHWIFGQFLAEAETYGRSVRSLLQITYGQYVQVPGAADLDDETATAFWFFALVFVVLVFFIVRFLFLAMIVHAYNEVKDNDQAIPPSRSFVRDIYEALIEPIHATALDWPSKRHLTEWMHRNGELITVEHLQIGFGRLTHKEGKVLRKSFMSYLENLSGKAPEAFVFLCDKNDRTKPEDLLRSTSPARRDKRRKMDVKRISQRCVHEVTSKLAQRDIGDVNWLNMTGQLTSTLYREFSDHGLIEQKRY